MSNSQPLHNLAGSESPIHVACQRKNHQLASLLLHHSPRLILLKQLENKTALHIACSNGDLQMVEIIFEYIRLLMRNDLVRGKEDDTLPTDVKDNLGRTPFFIACYYGYYDIAKRFVELKEELGSGLPLDVNAAVLETKRTPLHAAVFKNSTDIVNLLLGLKDTNLGVEARPASKTQEKLLTIIETKQHGCVMQSNNSANSFVDFESAELPHSYSNLSSYCTSPMSNFGSGTGTPVTGTGTSVTGTGPVCSSPDSGSYVSSAPIAFSAPPLSLPAAMCQSHSFTEVHQTPTFDDFKSSRKLSQTPTFDDFKPPRKLSQTPTTDDFEAPKKLKKLRSATHVPGMAKGDKTTLGIFEVQGELRIGIKGQSTGTRFSRIFLTPLHEACALGHDEIACQLLKYGAYDKRGLACQIAHLTQNFTLMQQILAYSCSSKAEQSSPGNPGLRIEWKEKMLPQLKGEWLDDSTVYYVFEKHDESEEVKVHHNSRRIEPQQLRKVRLSEAPIRVLDISCNCLKSLPLEVFLLEHLTRLNVSQNKLVELPVTMLVSSESGAVEATWNCKNLEQLNLNQNALERLPPCLWTLPCLKKVSANHNKLSSFSEEDIPNGTLSESLSVIELSNNNLHPELPSFLFEFPSLTKASFSHNKLTQLPETMWQNPTLQELLLADNLIECLPWCQLREGFEASLVTPKEYTILQQSEKVLTGVVEVKPTNPNGNPFRMQKSTVYKKIKPTGITELSWVNYSAVNTETYDYSALTKLDVSRNKLIVFPEALPCLAPNLTELNISYNKVASLDLQYVPQSIKKLLVHHCDMEVIGNVIDPERFKQIVKCCQCPMEEFAGKPCQHRNHTRLDHLAILSLSHNRIKHFQLLHHPPYESLGDDPGKNEKEKKFQHCISSLDLLYPALENLDLSSNDLRDLFNPNVGHLTHLKSIKLDSNPKLEKIPFEFSYLKKSKDFTELSIRNLPSLVKPPKEYQDAGLSHLLTYMRSCLKE